MRPFDISNETEWTLTATVNGEVVWIEEGIFEAFESPYTINSTSFTSSAGDSYSFDFEVGRKSRVVIEPSSVSDRRRQNNWYSLGLLKSCRSLFRMIERLVRTVQEVTVKFRSVTTYWDRLHVKLSSATSVILMVVPLSVARSHLRWNMGEASRSISRNPVRHPAVLLEVVMAIAPATRSTISSIK